MSAEPLFRRRDGLVVPQANTVGPWDANALHGGAVAALMTWALEAIEPDLEMPYTRVTCELLRPVPMAPLAVTAQPTRPGKKVMLVEVEVRAEGLLVARATGLRIRAADVDLPGGLVEAPDAPPPPAAGKAPNLTGWGRGLIQAMELRVVRGGFLEPGPATCWFRFPTTLVDEDGPSPLQRVMAAADFGNGLSGILDFTSHLYINPDLTVYLHRYPRGEWVALEAVTWVHEHGVGLAESRLWDEEGPIGRSLQSLLVGRRS
ncbi:MAG: thioesterase family protein [Candidatus Dormibacteria bacterium]